MKNKASHEELIKTGWVYKFGMYFKPSVVFKLYGVRPTIYRVSAIIQNSPSHDPLQAPKEIVLTMKEGKVMNSFGCFVLTLSQMKFALSLLEEVVKKYPSKPNKESAKQKQLPRRITPSNNFNHKHV